MDERTMRWWTSGLTSALIVLCTGRATAQGSPTGAAAGPAGSAAPAASPAPPTPEKADPSASPSSEAPLRMLAVTVGGGLAHASDEREASAQRGAVNIDVALRLGGAARGLEFAVGYDNLLGNWEYIQKNPSLDGSGPARAEAFEQRHRIALDVRYDVLRLIKKGLPIHLSPMLGLAFVRVDSSLFGSQMFGGGGGATVVAELDPRTSVDASFSVLRGFTGEGGEATLFGSITGLWNWGAGASIGATDWSRVRLGYFGEALDRQATTRFAHGVRLSLTVSFL